MILAFDLSTRRNGWCAGAGLEIPTAGAFVLPQTGDDIGQMLALLDDQLSGLFDRYQPALAVYESPILPQGAGRSTLMIRRKLFALGAHLEFVCKRRGVQCAEFHLRAIKKELGGSGYASKADMTYAAERLGVKLPETQAAGREDAADAAGLWLLALRHMDPKAAARFDTRLWTGRGALV